MRGDNAHVLGYSALEAVREDFLSDAYANEDLTFSAVYSDGAGVTTPIRVQFVRENSDITLGVVELHSGKPSARARTVDVPNLTNASTLTIEGVLFYVIDHNEMAHGETQIILSKDPS